MTYSNNTHIILFFDINDTIYIGDSAKGMDKKTAILKALSEQYSAIWDADISNDRMTCHDFVEQYLEKEIDDYQTFNRHTMYAIARLSLI